MIYVASAYSVMFLCSSVVILQRIVVFFFRDVTIYLIPLVLHDCDRWSPSQPLKLFINRSVTHEFSSEASDFCGFSELIIFMCSFIYGATRDEFCKTVKFALRISLSGICILDFFPSVPFRLSLPSWRRDMGTPIELRASIKSTQN